MFSKKTIKNEAQIKALNAALSATVGLPKLNEAIYDYKKLVITNKATFMDTRAFTEKLSRIIFFNHYTAPKEVTALFTALSGKNTLADSIAHGVIGFH